MEPGVYLLQISGSLTSCTATVKLVSDQLEGELVSLSSGQPGTFRSRSTIFTVEDDDRDAEKIVVDICDKVYPSGLIGVRWIRFLLFEFNHVLLLSSTIFKLTKLSASTFCLKHICRQKNIKEKIIVETINNYLSFHETLFY